MLMTFLMLGTVLNLVLVFILLFMDRGTLASSLKGIRKEVWVLLILITTAGLFLRLSSPMQHNFIDEDYRLNAAKNLMMHGNAEICYCTGYETEDCHPYFKPFGSVIIFSISFLVFGLGNYTAIYTSILFGTLCIPLAFILLYLIMKDTRPALYASALFSAYPFLVAASAMGEDFTIALFFALLSLSSLCLYLRNDDQKSLYLFLLTLAFTLNARIEFIAMLPTIIIMLHSRRSLLKRLHDYRFRAAIILSSSFFIIYLQRLWTQINTEFVLNQQVLNEQIFSVLGEFQACPGMSNGIAEILAGMASGLYYPLLFNILIAAGIFLGLQKKTPFPWSIGLIPISFIGLYAVSGFLQPMLLVFAISFLFLFVSSGISLVQDVYLTKKRFITALISLLLLISFAIPPLAGGDYLENTCCYTIGTKKYGFYSEPRILETKAMGMLGSELPDNAYVFSMSYHALSVVPGANPVPLHGAFYGNAVEEIIGNRGMAFFYDGYICRIPPYNQSCLEFLRVYETVPVAEYSLENLTYTLYSVKGRIPGLNASMDRIYLYPPWAYPYPIWAHNHTQE